MSGGRLMPYMKLGKKGVIRTRLALLGPEGAGAIPDGRARQPGPPSLNGYTRWPSISDRRVANPWHLAG